MRTLAKRLRATVAALGLLTGLVGGLVATAAPAGAGTDVAQRDTYCVENGCVRVLQVAGLVDPILADFVERGVDEANATPGFVGVVLELDSDGVVLDARPFADFARRLTESRVPVTAWVGTGAVARGGAAELVAVLPGSTMAPGAKVGEIGEQRLSRHAYGDLTEGERSVLVNGTVAADRAKEIGLIERVAPTAGDHLVGLEDVKVERTKGDDGEVRTRPVSRVVISKLGIWSQMLHTAASPALAYIFLCLGVGLLLFEFFTAGIGIAGVVGAGAFALSGYGLGVLPTRTWALVVLGVAAIAFAIDVQAGIPRFWTGVGTIGWVVGSIWLFDGVAAPWISLAVGIVGLFIGMVSGMPAMVRSRFGTPTIGREWMIGTTGTASTAVDPDGLVAIDGGQWRARTNRATPLAEGDDVRVVAIDGLTLEVEPLEGGAVDYRERSRR